MRSRFAMLLGALLALALIGAAPVAASKKSGGTYLALGDSVPAGTQQPLGFTDNGYPNVLFEKLEKKYGFDEFVNLACPADDSNEMLAGDNGPKESTNEKNGSFCYGTNRLYPSQIDAAVAAIEAAEATGDDVELITLTIGANDIFLCPIPTEVCINGVLGQWALNLSARNGIITRLSEAAGDDVPIVAMNYYNPDLAFWLTTPAEFQDDYLAGQVAFSAGGNAFIGQVYGPLGVPVVDVADAFKTFKTSGMVPKNVKEVCELTLMCEKDSGDYVLSDYLPDVPGDQTDIHPSNKGHKTIAKAFDKLIRKQKLLG